MNFKGFLKRTGFALLVEENEFDKDAFVRKAYKRVFKEKANMSLNTTDMWQRVLTKSAYKFKKGTSNETKQATIAARTAVNQLKKLKQQHTDLDLDDTGQDDREIKELVKDLDDNEKQDLLTFLKTDNRTKNLGIAFDENNIINIEDTFAGNAEALNAVKEKLNEIYSEEIKEEDIPEWKEKTVSELDDEDFTVQDFGKIKDKLREFFGKEITDKEALKEAIKTQQLTPDQVTDLDKILNTETQTTPAEPQETTTVNTQNTSIIDAGKEMEERILKQQKMERLKKAGVPLTPDGDPDFNQEITFQIMNQQKMNGDSTLWDEYIKTTGLEDSEYVKKFLENQKKQEETKKKAIEDQKQRFENEKSFATACSGVFAFTAALAMFLTSKNSSENLEKWNEQRKRISVLKDSMSEFSEDSMYVEKDGKKISREDIAKNDYNNEQQALLNDYNTRKAELEKESQDPRSTDAFKIKSTAILQQFANRKQELLKQNQELQPKQQRSADIKKVTLALISQSEDEQIETLKNVVPRNEGEDDNAYNVRLKTNKEQLISDLNNQAEQIDNEIAENIKQIDNLGKEMDNALKELEESDEVQKEFKKNSKNYQIKLSSLEAQYTLNKNKSTQDYERRMRAIKQQLLHQHIS